MQRHMSKDDNDGKQPASAAAAGADAGSGTTPGVKLSELEEKVFAKILNAVCGTQRPRQPPAAQQTDAVRRVCAFVSLVSQAKHHGLKTQIRVAGGWVRDKLLGRESVDIDLALDNMTGVEFAAKVNEYLKTQGEKVHDVGVIKLNPGQSKHLETATFKVDGVSIDASNLRTETYDENSRIPQMRLGTARQDCLRRDFTINSMFYNLNTREIEDLSGKGLDDLKRGVIRTPLLPLMTFKDVCRARRRAPGAPVCAGVLMVVARAVRIHCVCCAPSDLPGAFNSTWTRSWRRRRPMRRCATIC